MPTGSNTSCQCLLWWQIFTTAFKNHSKELRREVNRVECLRPPKQFIGDHKYEIRIFFTGQKALEPIANDVGSPQPWKSGSFTLGIRLTTPSHSVIDRNYRIHYVKKSYICYTGRPILIESLRHYKQNDKTRNKVKWCVVRCALCVVRCFWYSVLLGDSKSEQ